LDTQTLENRLYFAHYPKRTLWYRLFSTLDTLIRRIQLGQNFSILISDTVGFIRKLPHQLVSAFRATLEEVVEADLILHVVDISDPAHEQKREVVLKVLEEIGAGNHPMLTVYNKIDLAPIPSSPGRGREARAREGEALLDAEGLVSNGIWVSAVTGEGLHDLVEKISQEVTPVRA
jgi:GTP-binding protein HflX